MIENRQRLLGGEPIRVDSGTPVQKKKESEDRHVGKKKKKKKTKQGRSKEKRTNRHAQKADRKLDRMKNYNTI